MTPSWPPAAPGPADPRPAFERTLDRGPQARRCRRRLAPADAARGPRAARAARAAGERCRPRCGRSAAPWSARRAAPPGSSGSGGSGPCDHLVLWLLAALAAASRRSSSIDPGEQLAGEHRAGVVEAEVASQADRAREQRGVLRGGTGARPPVPPRALDQPEPNQPARRARDGCPPRGRATRSRPAPSPRVASRVPVRVAMRCGGRHQRPFRGSNFDAEASRSNSSRSFLVSFFGTLIVTTAYRSPAGAPPLPGMPWPRSLQPPAAGRARRNLDAGVAVERRHRNLGAERRLPRRDREIDVQVAPLDAEAGVRPEPDPQEQVAGRPAADARRRPVRPPGSAARRARRAGCRPRPSARRRATATACRPAAASSSARSSTASWSPPRIENPSKPARPAAACARRPKKLSKKSLKSPPPNSTRDVAEAVAGVEPVTEAARRRKRPARPSSWRRGGRSARASRGRAAPRRPRRSA